MGMCEPAGCPSAASLPPQGKFLYAYKDSLRFLVGPIQSSALVSLKASYLCQMFSVLVEGATLRQGNQKDSALCFHKDVR